MLTCMVRECAISENMTGALSILLDSGNDRLLLKTLERVITSISIQPQNTFLVGGLVARVGPSVFD
jgi:heme O synthase-like polyprenyltransferase